MFNTNLETIILKVHDLEGSTWIKSGVVVKEAFKNWKVVSISTLQEKCWLFQVKQVRGAIIVK